MLRDLDGSLSAMYDGKCFALKTLAALEKATSNQPSAGKSRAVVQPRKQHKPSSEHPWRKPMPMVKRRRDPVEDYFEKNEWRHQYAQY